MNIDYPRKPYKLPIRHFVALFLAITLGSVLARVYSQSLSYTAPVGIENFGKVNDNYYRGAQPDAARFRELKRLGVKTVVDLRNDKLEEAPDWARAAGLQYINIPLTTKSPATEEQTSQFLGIVNDQNNWPVFVHCKGGRHRTGEMTAIYRITHDGWTGDQAYAEMKKFDFENNMFYPRSLRKYVFSYYEQFMSNKGSTPQPSIVTTSAVPR